MNFEIIVHSLANQFMELYREHIFKDEYDPLLTNGYCLYFASLLKTLFPEGVIYSTSEYHFIFYYQENYYDGNGKIFQIGDYLSLDTFLPIANLREVKDVEEELFYTELFDVDYKKKETVWNVIGPLLVLYGRQLQESFGEEKRTLS